MSESTKQMVVVIAKNTLAQNKAYFAKRAKATVLQHEPDSPKSTEGRITSLLTDIRYLCEVEGLDFEEIQAHAKTFHVNGF